MDKKVLLHEKNRLMLKLLWFSFILALAVDIAAKVPIAIIYILGSVGAISVILITILVKKKIMTRYIKPRFYVNKLKNTLIA